MQIDRRALIHNVRALRSLIDPGVDLFAVVKGNAYGHGLKEVVTAVESEVDGFQVDDIEELRGLRASSSKRALVLGFVASGDIAEVVRLSGELSVFDIERLSEIERAGKDAGERPKIHLKVDALLGRLGVLPGELPQLTAKVNEYHELDLVAAYAHFANIEDTTDLGHAFDQAEVFETCWKEIRNSGWPKLGRHLSATSGAMTSFKGNDLVRFGIGIYGMYPSVSLGRRNSELELRPAMRWVSHLAQVKVLPAHHPVGYGLTFITPREMRVGIVPQGYSDGFDRGLSNSGEVLVRGVRCAVVGRVAMNMFAVDLSGVAASSEDEVVLLGAQGDERITAEEIASRLGTINYEVTARVSALLPRIVV